MNVVATVRRLLLLDRQHEYVSLGRPSGPSLSYDTTHKRRLILVMGLTIAVLGGLAVAG